MFLASARPFARRGVSHLRGGRAVVAEQLSASLFHGLYNRPRTVGRSDVDAAFLVAARVSLPPAGAVVPVDHYLSASWVARLSASDGLLRADCRAAFGYSVRPGDPPQLSASEVGRLMPKPVFLINRSEYRQLLTALHDRGLVTFRDPRTLPKHPVTGEVLVAGMFGSQKKNGTQRLLLDRRPGNAIENRLVGLALPFPGDFVRVELGTEEVVRTSLRDGKDQYYVLRQSDTRVDWQAFGRPVDLGWLPDAPVPADTPWLQAYSLVSSVSCKATTTRLTSPKPSVARFLSVLARFRARN